MKKFFPIYLMIIIILVLFTSGCAAKQEIEKLAIVVASGFDYSADGKYVVTVQILKTQKQPSAGMGGKESSQQPPVDVIVFSSKGDSIFDAINNLYTQLGKKLLFAHDKFILIGEDLAKSGVSILIDSALRGRDTRPNIPIFVAKGKASDIVKAVTPEESIPANAIENIMTRQLYIGFSPLVSKVDFDNALASKFSSPIAGVMELQKNIMTINGEIFRIEGTAVFKKDKLIGYMNKTETRGMQWIKGKVKAGDIIIPSPDKGKITLEIIRSSSNVRPIIKNNRLIMQINVNEEGNIREMTGKLDPMKNPKIIDQLEKLQDEAIKREIEIALNTAQKKYKADIFEFGNKIHKSYPKIWEKIEKKWDVIFPYLDVEIKVNSHLRRIGTISRPLY
ncbi:spore germination protein KC [Caldanaerobius fijiensis DSM 17918]|uniref:Spore germination protein KC n=1 Tax=Caldanaerobius fijiensis DSM 17918 TaxID=1121256 RepID=A0A1M4SPG5_9THEO|nr:Ger(x)C family spore germination protein [Caldanaerobius fijiensis]SHE34088.1 spore germination protein KC [Caldanaerobius fijiensis DSM 17918]